MLDQNENMHGGDIFRASKLYGLKNIDFLDYSANINPLGLSDDLRELLISNIDRLKNYPDPDCTDLKADISNYLGVEEISVIIGNGASEIIFLLFDALRPKKVLLPAPTFSEYAHAAHRSGVEVEYFELKEENDFKLDVHGLLDQLSGNTDTIFLCNPNNPTSVLTSVKELLYLIKQAKVKGMNIIIDEAFIELTSGADKNSMMEYVKQFPNLFIIRAFTKLFAIPGLRLGYGVGNPDFIKRMWDRKMPWSVNALACGIGSILADQTGYLKRTSIWLEEELGWFYNELKNLSGLKVFQPDTNFVLIRLLDQKMNSHKIKDLMAVRGILIRDAANFKFLDDRFIRVAVKDRESNIRFLREFKEVLNTE
jgi:threonine-phosphate decarboxylase